MVTPTLIERRAAVDEDFRSRVFGTDQAVMDTLARAAMEAGMSLMDLIHSELGKSKSDRITTVLKETLKRIYDAEKHRLARRREVERIRRSRPGRVVIKGLPLKRFYRVRRRLLDSWSNTEHFLNEAQCDLEQENGPHVKLVTMYRYGGPRINVVAVFQVDAPEEVVRNGKEETEG